MLLTIGLYHGHGQTKYDLNYSSSLDCATTVRANIAKEQYSGWAKNRSIKIQR